MALLRRHIVTLNKIICRVNGVNAKFYSTRHRAELPALHRSQRWWIIEGDIYPIGPQLRPQVVSTNNPPPPSKKERKLARAGHVSRIHITESGSQELYWRKYMEAFQRARNEWEKLVWDKPKRDLFDDFDEDDEFFDKIVEKKKKKKAKEEDRSNIYATERRNKPYSKDEIQAAFQEDYRRSFTARSASRKGYGDGRL